MSEGCLLLQEEQRAASDDGKISLKKDLKKDPEKMWSKSVCFHVYMLNNRPVGLPVLFK